jgi:hypothetical protein
VGDPANGLVYYPGLVFVARGQTLFGGTDPNGVYVETRNLGGTLSDWPFHLDVNCDSLHAVITSNGFLARGADVTSVSHLGPGRYEVTFNRNVSTCAYVATIGDIGNTPVYNAGLVFVAGGHGVFGFPDPQGVYVETKNLGGGLSDWPFHLDVACGPVDAVVSATGSLARGSAVIGVTHLGTGRYEVTFSQDVSTCAYTTTIGDTAHGLVYYPGLVYSAGGHAPAGGADPNGVYIETKNLGGGLSDWPFHLEVTC